MGKWSRQSGKDLVRSVSQGDEFAAVYECESGWVVEFYYGPKGIYPVPSREKGIAWADRFGDIHSYYLGREASTPGGRHGVRTMTYTDTEPEVLARYAAIAAMYVPPKNKRRRPR